MASRRQPSAAGAPPGARSASGRHAGGGGHRQQRGDRGQCQERSETDADDPPRTQFSHFPPPFSAVLPARITSPEAAETKQSKFQPIGRSGDRPSGGLPAPKGGRTRKVGS